jgi:hypothetical protein
MPTAPPKKKGKPATAGGVSIEVTDDGKVIAKGSGANLKGAAAALTPTPKAKKSTGHTPPPTVAADERAYKAAVEAVSKDLSLLDVKSLHLSWERASKAYNAIKELERKFDKPKEKMYEDLAHGNPWAADTIKKAILTCARLVKVGHQEMFDLPATGFTQVTDILNAKKLSDDTRKTLLVRVYKHDRKEIARRHTVKEVRGMIKDLEPPTDDVPNWKRGIDLWAFPDHDERYGASGFPTRLPGQAHMNLISRFTMGATHVLSVGCGGGTLLDVCSASELKGGIGKQYRGVDIKLHPRVIERHSDHAIEMDCTKSVEHWDRVCAPEWADLAVVTLPLFEFNVSARTSEKTDLDNVTDPKEWLGLMAKAIFGAYSRLAVNGILAVHSHSTSRFENGQPVPDLDFQICSMIQELTTFFEARITVDVKKARPSGSPEDADWLTPHASYIHVYRKI